MVDSKGNYSCDLASERVENSYPFPSPDLFLNSPDCLLNSSCGASLENLVLDQLMIPSLIYIYIYIYIYIFFLILIPCLLDISPVLVTDVQVCPSSCVSHNKICVNMSTRWGQQHIVCFK